MTYKGAFYIQIVSAIIKELAVWQFPLTIDSKTSLSDIDVRPQNIFQRGGKTTNALKNSQFFGAPKKKIDHRRRKRKFLHFCAVLD